jgi:hypothetical protein
MSVQSYGTSPVAAQWQGFFDFDSMTLITRAGLNAVLTRVSVGSYLLNCLPFWCDDEDTIISINLYNNGQENPYYYDVRFHPAGDTDAGQVTIAIVEDDDGNLVLADPPGLFNIVVTQCTDGVSQGQNPGGQF